MPIFVTKDGRAGWAAIRPGALPETIQSGFGWDSSNNPILVDTAGNTSLSASPTALIFKVGTTTIGTIAASTPIALSTKLSVAGASGSAGVFASLANPFGADVIVTRAIFRTTVIATAAATVDIGIGADATTSNDGLMDGLDVNAALGVFDSSLAANAGTNGRPSEVWATTGFLNVAEASGNVNGLVGIVYIEAILV